MRKIVKAITSQPWLIQRDSLETILSIAEGYKAENIELLEAKIGKPLDNSRTVTIRDRTAIIPVVGPIFRYANLFTAISGATSTEILALDFKKAEEDPEVDRIILNVDSPGGQAPGIADLASLVKNSSKPVISFIGGLGASAAYWFPSAASEVVISRSAEAGSIGAVFVVGTGEDENSVTIISKQSPNKRLDPKTESGMAELQKRIDNIAQVFVEDVASFRGVTVDKVLSDFGQGGLLLGQAAVDAGLADRVGTFESLFEEKRIMSSTTGITLETLTADHPEVVETIKKQGYDEGFSAGKVQGQKDEVARIKDVREQSIPGHEALIESLMFDGKSTGADAALAIVQAEKKVRSTSLKEFKESAPPVVEDISTDNIDDRSKKLTGEEKLKHDWDNDPELQGKFAYDYEAYESYMANIDNVVGAN